jgi:hypothetical protein
MPLVTTLGAHSFKEVNMQDKLGQELEIGDEVIIATTIRNTAIGEITSIGKKMIVVKVANSYGTHNRYPTEALKVGSTRKIEDSSSIPQNVAATINHSLRVANGVIPASRLEKATEWVNSLVWTKE